MRNSIESIFTRGISILSKFLLLGYLAKILTLEDYGSFQLISYFIMISTTIFGLEYYNIGNRDIVNSNDKDMVYRSHLRFFYSLSPILFFIQVLVFLSLFPKTLISFKNGVLILIIGIIDYFSQEVYRYLMINKEYRRGNVQLIFKSFFFMVLILGYRFFFDELDFANLLKIFLLSYLLLFLFVYRVFSKHLYHIKFGDFRFLPMTEIKRIGLNLSPFLLLIFFIKGIEFVDKFLIGKQLGLAETGIYSFLFAMSSILGVFVISGFYIIYLPQLIDSFKDNIQGFKKFFFKFSLLTVLSSLVLAVLIVLVSPYIFSVIEKEIMLQHLDLLYLLVIGFVLHNISLVPHVFLYVCHDEKRISAIMGIGFLVNLALNWVFIPKFGINGAGYSFLVTYIIIVALKSLRAILKWRILIV